MFNDYSYQLAFKKIEKENQEKSENVKIRKESSDVINNQIKNENPIIDKINKEKSCDFLNDLTAEDLQFSFCDFLTSLVSDTKKSKVYLVAHTNLLEHLDVWKFLQLKQEVALLKELILDKKQLLIFNTFSTVISLRNLFKEISKLQIDFTGNHKDQNKILFDSLRFTIK